jgi:hypothetical protein
MQSSIGKGSGYCRASGPVLSVVIIGLVHSLTYSFGKLVAIAVFANFVSGDLGAVASLVTAGRLTWLRVKGEASLFALVR